MATNPTDSLRYELELNSNDMIQVLKGLSNEKRFQILTILLGEARSFRYLLDKTGLQKSALANHLTLLVQLQLVEKSEYGYYKLAPDSKNILQTLCNMWQKVITSREEQLQTAQGKPLSEEFLGAFFRHP